MSAAGTNFVIPKKAKKDNSLSPSHQHIYQISDGSNAFRNEVVLPFFENLLLSTLRGLTSLSKVRRIQNDELQQRFLRRQKQLRKRGAPTDFCYAFLPLDPNDDEEDNYIAKNGLYAGYTVYDDLGPAEEGLVLSLHPDCCSPAFFGNHCNSAKILICKVLKGRTRTVQSKLGLGQDMAAKSLDPSFQSYISLQYRASDHVNETPLQRFRCSQLYLYEFNEANELCDRLCGVLPWAIVNVKFDLERSNVRCYNLMQNEVLVWNGCLKFKDLLIENVHMFSIFKEGLKPFGICDVLKVDSLISWADCLKYQPISELASSADLCGKLTESSCVEFKIRKSGTIQYFYASYFTLSRKNSQAFGKVHNTLRTAQSTGFLILPNGVLLFLIPNGELSSLLALPNSFEFPVFHCVVLNIGTKVDEEFSLSSANDEMISVDSVRELEPTEAEKLDTRASILGSIAEFNAEWENESTSHLDPAVYSGELYGSSSSSVVNSVPRNFGKTLPCMSVPPPSLTSTIASSPLYHQMYNSHPPMSPSISEAQTQQIPHAKPSIVMSTAATMDTNQCSSRNVVVTTAEDIATNDKHQKQKNLFQQTIQSVKNFKKESSTVHMDSFPQTDHFQRQQQANKAEVLPHSILRDPRLKRVAATDPRSVQKILGVDPSKQSAATPQFSSSINTSAYSPSDQVQSMSATSLDINDVDGAETSNFMKNKPFNEKSKQLTDSNFILPIKKKETDMESYYTPSKIFQNVSSIFGDGAAPFTDSFVTSTPKATEANPPSTGLNFDFMNWNSRPATKMQPRDASSFILSEASISSPASPCESQQDTFTKENETLIPLISERPKLDVDEEDDFDSQKLRIVDDEISFVHN